MKTLTSTLKRFFSNEAGLETVEYAVIAALITGAAIAAITLVGTNVGLSFSNLAAKLAP